MDENYAIARYEQAAVLLPMRWQRPARQLPEWQKAQAEEMRLRVGQSMTVLLPEGELFLPQDGQQMMVTQNDLEQLCDSVTGYSRYAAGETLRCGYLTAQGGFRIGVCGTVVMQEGESRTLRDFSSAVIRISRQRPGLSRSVLPQLIENGRLCSTLILSPPGLGKTTLLRDLILQLSDGNPALPAHRVAVADERGEIAVMYHGRAQMSVGCHTDVMDACPKAQAIPMLLRAVNPQVIAVDEITVREDLRAMAWAANCGVRLLATIHAGSVEELGRKPLFAQLLEMGVFEKCVLITSDGGRRSYEVSDL